MGIIMKFIGISRKNNAQKREHNLLKPSPNSDRHTCCICCIVCHALLVKTVMLCPQHTLPPHAEGPVLGSLCIV